MIVFTVHGYICIYVFPYVSLYIFINIWHVCRCEFVYEVIAAHLDLVCSMAIGDVKGSGFVHLNTPASITYTAGQVLTVSELKRKKQRVECVLLPCVIQGWRRAMQQYSDEEGFIAFPGDTDNEKLGRGVIYPSVMPTRSVAISHVTSVSGTSQRTISSHCASDDTSCLSSDGLFSPVCGATSRSYGSDDNAVRECRSATTAGVAEEAPCDRGCSDNGNCASGLALSSSPSFGVDTKNEQIRTKSVSHTHNSSSSSTDSRAEANAARVKRELSSVAQNGIAIVSHHKVAGVKQFVYPDYDGVLSHGVIPRVVESPEEKSETAALRLFYVSAAQMTEEERQALEDLQTLWRSRAHSHSIQGASHRAALGGGGGEGGDVSVGSEKVSCEGYRGSENRREGGEGRMKLSHHHDKRISSNTVQRTTGMEKNRDDDSEREAGDGVVSADSLLEEALRMADDLLHFA